MTKTASITPELLQVFEAVPDLYLIISPDLTILTASKLYLKATLQELKTIRGKYLFEAFPDNPALYDSDATANLRASLEWVLEHNKPHQMALQRYDVPNPDIPGSFLEKYWRPLNTPVLDDEENLFYIIHKVEDATAEIMAQKRIEKGKQELLQLSGEQETTNSNLVTARAEVELEQRKLHTLLMQAPAMICIFEGPEHVFKLANPPYQQLVGNRPLLGKPVAEAMPELAGQPMFTLLDNVYRTGESLYSYEMKMQFDHDNSGALGDNYYNLTYQATRNLSGEVEGIMVFAYEVTAQVEARQKVEQREQEARALTNELAAKNEELSKTNEQLKRINLDLDNFIYTASHDLKAPIYNIEGLLRIIIQSIPADAQLANDLESVIQMIENSIDRFKRTIEHLTDVTRLHKEYNQEAIIVDLGKVIRDVKLDLFTQIKAVGADLKVDVSACPDVSFSEKNLRSIIYNLLSNAIKYSSHERTPEIKISCYPDGDFVVLKVKDNGLGMKLDSNQKLFAMFGRLHDHVEGAGIGLYMVKRIVENMGGRIEVESEVGVGSTFKVYLKS